MRILPCVMMLLCLQACSALQNGLLGGESDDTFNTSLQQFNEELGNVVYFTTDSTELNADSASLIAKQAQWLLAHPSYKILVEGHADERGTREYNFALGLRRALSVADALKKDGVQKQNIRVVSYGKERPVLLCDNISCWSKNRRAVIVISR